MTNTKKRKKLIWGAMMLMNDIQRFPNRQEPLQKAALKITTRSLRKCASSAGFWSGRGTS